VQLPWVAQQMPRLELHAALPGVFGEHMQSLPNDSQVTVVQLHHVPVAGHVVSAQHAAFGTVVTSHRVVFGPPNSVWQEHDPLLDDTVQEI
jgi:hypothetical protein